ncbi:hypothetical protein N9420_01745 [Flavobacteriaceae bacterium]|nr:hypothetical protein [Flavobacteriaceae bacterium]
MKKIILPILLFACFSNAQFNYQSILKDNNGSVIVNTSITYKISFIYDSSSGSTVYSETHSTTTPVDGIINLVIGSGTAISGTFSSIDWSRTLYIKREADLTGSGTYTNFGTTLLNSVPKSNFAQKTSNFTVSSTTVGIGTGTNTLADYTISIGPSSLPNNSSGSNIAIGYEALYLNTSGADNVAAGKQTLKNATSSLNTGIGNFALYDVTTGGGNTAIGRSAGINNQTGSNNTYLGYGAKTASSVNTTNSTAIGAMSTVTTSNTIQLGDTNITLVNTSGTVSASAFVGDGSGLTNLSVSGPTYKSSMVLQDSSSAAADSQIDLPGLSFRWKENSSGVGKLEVRAESGNAPQALIFYFSYHTNGNDTINFRPDTTSASSSSWNAVDDSWGTTLPSITGYYAVYEFDFSVYPINTSGNHFGRTYNVKLFLGGWGGVHMRAFYQ